MDGIRLMADYECFPLWRDGRNIDPAELAISGELATALTLWAADFDATLNEEYPPDSGFADEQAEQEFRDRGRELARRLADELGGNMTVDYIEP
jgi:hypothetical protein